MINKQLREHVTSTAFALSLSKTQVSTLIYLSECAARKGYLVRETSQRSPDCFIPAVRALARKGMVLYERDAKGDKAGPFMVTLAGRATITLLRESGLYDEYAAQLESPKDDGLKHSVFAVLERAPKVAA